MKILLKDRQDDVPSSGERWECIGKKAVSVGREPGRNGPESKATERGRTCGKL